MATKTIKESVKTENSPKPLLESLQNIQSQLNVPKGLRNSFGNYNYRSAELILEAVKPLLAYEGCVIIITDRVELIGDRYYLIATARLENMHGESVSVEAYAREEENKKGMDSSQVTGATSSYARKYALNGLLLIDDNKDADTDEYAKQQKKDDSGNKPKVPTATPETTVKPWLNQNTKELDAVVKALKTKKKTLAEIKDYYNINKTILAELEAIV